MHEIILKIANKSSKSSNTVAGIVKGIALSRSVSSTRCAQYISSNAKAASKIKSVERCYAHGYVDVRETVDFLCSRFDKDASVITSLDRTNWEHGEQDINALVVYCEGSSGSGMVNLKLLDNKGGSSNFDDRKEVLDPVFERMKGKIRVLLGDREFFSFEFVNYLIENDIPFVIRIKKSLKCAKELVESLGHISKTLRNCVIGKFRGKAVRLDLSAKKLQKEDLIVVSYKVHNPLKAYRRRWKIESFFKCLKTAGFNLESTKLTILSRLEALFLLCGMAYTFCVRVGLWAHRHIAKIKYKATLKCYQFSFFRYGLDYLVSIAFAAHIPRKIYRLKVASTFLTVR